MTKKRTLLVVFACGLWTLLANAAMDRDWPDYSATWWVIFVAGLLVIALAVIGIESVVARRRTDN